MRRALLRTQSSWGRYWVRRRALVPNLVSSIRFLPYVLLTKIRPTVESSLRRAIRRPRQPGVPKDHLLLLFPGASLFWNQLRLRLHYPSYLARTRIPRGHVQWPLLSFHLGGLRLRLHCDAFLPYFVSLSCWDLLFFVVGF